MKRLRSVMANAVEVDRWAEHHPTLPIANFDLVLFCRRHLWILLLIIGSMAVAAQAVAQTPKFREFCFEIQYSKSEKQDLTGYSKHVSLPQGKGIIKGSNKVLRLDPVKRVWVEETGGWDFSPTTVSGSAPQTTGFEFDIKGAKSVPPGTTLRFCVTFNTNDVGASQTSDFKHPPAVKPRAAQSIDRLPGGPKFLVDATIDNAVFAGGATGLTLSELGIAVPANEFAYLYQLNNMTGQTPLTEFRIYDSAPFSSLIALSFSHDAASSPILLGEGFDLDPDSGVVDSLFPVFEGPGASGFLPVSWAVSGGDIVASFAGLAPGQSSGILVGFSSFAPGLGTVSITDGTNAVTNALFRPVPEPPTLLLVMTSLVALLRYKRLLRRR